VGDVLETGTWKRPARTSNQGKGGAELKGSKCGKEAEEAKERQRDEKNATSRSAFKDGEPDKEREHRRGTVGGGKTPLLKSLRKSS